MASFETFTEGGRVAALDKQVSAAALAGCNLPLLGLWCTAVAAATQLPVLLCVVTAKSLVPCTVLSF